MVGMPTGTYAAISSRLGVKHLALPALIAIAFHQSPASAQTTMDLEIAGMEHAGLGLRVGSISLSAEIDQGQTDSRPVLRLTSSNIPWELEGIGSGHASVEIQTSHLGISEESTAAGKFIVKGTGGHPAIADAVLELAFSKKSGATVVAGSTHLTSEAIPLLGKMNSNASWTIELHGSSLRKFDSSLDFGFPGQKSRIRGSCDMQVSEDGGMDAKIIFPDGIRLGPLFSLRDVQVALSKPGNGDSTPDDGKPLTVTLSGGALKAGPKSAARADGFKLQVAYSGKNFNHSAPEPRNSQSSSLADLLGGNSPLDGIELALEINGFNFLDYWKGSKLQLNFGPDREISLTAPDSSLHWEYFDSLTVEGNLRMPYPSLRLVAENQAIQVGAEMVADLFVEEGGSDGIMIGIPEFSMSFDDTYGLAGMLPDLPNFVTTGSFDGRANARISLKPGSHPEWNAALNLAVSELLFPDLDIEVRDLQSTLTVRNPPQPGTAMSSTTGFALPGLAGPITIGALNVPDVAVSPIHLEFIEDSQDRPFLVLREAGLLGGSFSSAPIFLGKAPGRIAAHFNVTNLDAHAITALIKDFKGELYGKLNGQVALLWNMPLKASPKLRFQYGHFYLNNPAESSLQWDADGILTRNMDPGQWTYSKSQEMEYAISNLKLRQMNVFLTNSTDMETLMEVMIDGIPADGALRNPVLLNLNIKGKWQSLIDYMFHGAGMKLDFSVN